MSVEKKEFAGFWIRFGAAIIDVLALAIFSGLNMYNTFSLKSIPLMIAIMTLLMAYKPFMEYKYGATFGKMAVKLKVTNHNFENISFDQSLIRSLPWLITSIISIVLTYLLMSHPSYMDTTGFTNISLLQKEITPAILQWLPTGILLITGLSILTNKKKMGLHDSIAKTYCIDLNDKY